MGIPMGASRSPSISPNPRTPTANDGETVATREGGVRLDARKLSTPELLAALLCRIDRVFPMSRPLWTAILALTLVPRPARADDWWGRDKALHFTLSIGISSAAYAAAAPLTERRDYRAGVGAATALTLGAMKEGYDALGHGDPSWRDFAWDLAGTAVGVMIAYAVDCIVSEKPNRGSRTATAASPLAIPF
jgi:putative lipoprotein